MQETRLCCNEGIFTDTAPCESVISKKFRSDACVNHVGVSVKYNSGGMSKLFTCPLNETVQSDTILFGLI